MIASIFSGLGYGIGMVLAFVIIAIAITITFGVLVWILRAALRFLFDVSIDFVPNLKRWATRNRTSD